MPVTLGLSSDWLGHNDQEWLHLEPRVCGISPKGRPEPERVWWAEAQGERRRGESRESEAPMRHSSAWCIVYGAVRWAHGIRAVAVYLHRPGGVVGVGVGLSKRTEE